MRAILLATGAVATLSAAAAQVVPPNGAQLAVDDRIRQLAREKLRYCWDNPTSVSPEDARALTVTISFELNVDGTLAGEPVVVFPHGRQRRAVREAIQAARDAIVACAPYNFHRDATLAEHYESWRALEFTFAPGL